MRIEMRSISVQEITKNIKEMCIEANYVLSEDVKSAIYQNQETESNQIGKQILSQLKENMDIAKNESIPICQDTGMAVIFMKIGQDVHFEGGNLEDAINEGIRQGYEEGYLRKSVVKDPVERVNTKDNTPGVIHYEIVSGDQVEITVSPKGFGSENMSRVCMLKPADGIEGIKDAILETVKLAGPNACPPVVVGVGIGGTFEKCALLAKKALTRELGSHNPIPYVSELEEEMLEKINNIGIGPAGLGGNTTALGINIETYPTHIAGLPVAINMCCHVNRHKNRII
jgi:fumarate hydratase subunit alpha